MDKYTVYPICLICAVRIPDRSFDARFDGQRPYPWHPNSWRSTGIVFSGPRWPSNELVSVSMRLSDNEISSSYATGIGIDILHEPDCTQMRLIPSGNTVRTQYKAKPAEDNGDGLTETPMCAFGVHVACEDISKRVMESSKIARIRSRGDLYMTIERRMVYAEKNRQRPRCRSFLPPIPQSLPGEPISRKYNSYYIPSKGIKSGISAGWWDDDPLYIPDLTTKLLSNLERANANSPVLPQFSQNFDSLPPEIKDAITLFLLGNQVQSECNYLVPQSFWYCLLLKIPFLWDLDVEVLDAKVGEGIGWDWEKLARRVLAPVTVTGANYWNYSHVQLNVPNGLTNRRRIWQILEEMYPNDVGLGQEDETRANVRLNIRSIPRSAR